MSSLLSIEDLSKSYPSPGGGRIDILSSLSLSIEKGEIVSIMGKSGSGKSTLLSIAALLMPPDSGRVLYNGRDSIGLSEREAARLRSCTMGFVFQSSTLLADFSALENVAIPLLIQGKNRKEAYARAGEILSLVGLHDRAAHRSQELSGGERQRVAIARALSGSPEIIFADEPTGSLDEKSADAIEHILLGTVKESGSSMLFVTHNSSFAAKADRMLILREGTLHEA